MVPAQHLYGLVQSHIGKLDGTGAADSAQQGVELRQIEAPCRRKGAEKEFRQNPRRFDRGKCGPTFAAAQKRDGAERYRIVRRKGDRRKVADILVVEAAMNRRRFDRAAHAFEETP